MREILNDNRENKSICDSVTKGGGGGRVDKEKKEERKSKRSCSRHGTCQIIGLDLIDAPLVDRNQVIGGPHGGGVTASGTTTCDFVLLRRLLSIFILVILFQLVLRI